MPGPSVFTPIILLVASLWAIQDAPAPAAASCREWRECQRLALEAYAQRDYEKFHDLAWLTVQKGPARDPELMFLLARAQSLSGRPHDALVMLARLAQQGLATDAATSDDFANVRQLRQSELAAASTAATRPADVAPPAVAAPVVPAPVIAAPVETRLPEATTVPKPRRQAEEALRIPGTLLGSAGLAYDRVSSRFIVTDAGLRDLMIIDERSRHVMVLVTSASAGFYEITGMEIDSSRGDLWVVSAEKAAADGDAAAATALHKVQLVSGRPLERIPIPTDLQPCRLADVAIAHDGSVLVLDSAGARLLRFRQATRTFTPLATLRLQSPTSFASASERIVYVAHAAGIARVDIVTGAVHPLASAPNVTLAGFERIRWAKNSLVGVQRLSDGQQRVVRIKLNGRRATTAEVIDSTVSPTDHPVSTISGDDLYFLVHEPAGDAADVVILRSRMR